LKQQTQVIFANPWNFAGAINYGLNSRVGHFGPILYLLGLSIETGFLKKFLDFDIAAKEKQRSI
jgi:hypothetical protein